jgi:two-component system, OmpR family, sensor histidine kinase KdpD
VARVAPALHGRPVIRESGDIDVQVITPSPQQLRDQDAARIAARWELAGYLRGVGLVVLATILGELVSPYSSPANILIWYVLAVVVAAFYLGRLQSIFVSALSVLAFNMLFVPPHFTFFVADPQYLITFLGLFVVGGAISELVNRARKQTLASLARERETAQLYAMSYDLSGAVGLEAIIQAILKMGPRYSKLPLPSSCLTQSGRGSSKDAASSCPGWNWFPTNLPSRTGY